MFNKHSLSNMFFVYIRIQ